MIATASELIRLAKSIELQDIRTEQSAAPESEPDSTQLMTLAREAYRLRRMRAQVFGDSDLFGEPAWDMLLDLFIATGEGKRVPVTSACIGAAVPTTTALRWLTMLEDRGLVVREHDKHDARRIFVRLTSDAEAKMAAYFSKSSSPFPRSGTGKMPEGDAVSDGTSSFMLGN